MFLVGLAVGAVACYYLQRPALEYLKAEVKVARREVQEATDRLLYSFKNENLVPAPRPIEAPPPPQPLPPVLQAEVNQWESPESRLAVEAKIRGMMQKGMEPTRILLELDREHP